MARRPLITEKDVLSAASSGKGELTVEPGSIITPLARDTARQRGIGLVTRNTEQNSSEDPHDRPIIKTLAIGSDHAGFGYKTELKPLIESLGWTVIDLGTHSENRCDYPDFAYAVGRTVLAGKAYMGIMIDGAGIGSAMVCNKIVGVRAACAYNDFTAWNARAHNDANVLTLGSRTLGIEVCKRIVKTFLSTEFEGGRHLDRLQKLTDVEQRFLPPAE